MRIALALILAVAVPIPAFAQSASYDEAVAARIAGDPARAVTLLQPIVAADPGNADAQVQLGLALLALDRLDPAERAFRAALAAAPDYADARLGLARIAYRQGRYGDALDELGHVDPDYADAAELRSQLERAEADAGPAWQLDLDGNYSALEDPQRDWKEAELRLRRRLSPRTAIGGRIHVAERFGRTDVYGELGGEFALSERVSGYAAIGGTPDAAFLPEWQLSLGGSARVTDGPTATVLTLDLREAEYVSGDIQTVTPGIEQYFAGGKAWVTARWINTFDETGDHHGGYLFRLDGMASDTVRLFAGYSDASDTSAGVVIDTQSYFGGASIEIADNTTLRLSAAHEDRATGSERTQFALGLGFGF